MGFQQASLMPKALLPTVADKPIILFVKKEAFELGCIVSYMESEFPNHIVIGLPDIEETTAFIGRKVVLTIVDLHTDEWRSQEHVRKIAELGTKFPESAVAFSTAQEPVDGGSLTGSSCVRGVFPTSLPPPVVAAIIRVIIAGGDYFPRASIEPAAESQKEYSTLVDPSANLQPVRGPAAAVMLDAAPTFTNRESQILEKLAEGLPNKLIAAALGMPENTVKVHIRNIMRKLKVTNRTAAVLAAQRLNVIAFDHP